MGVSFLAEARTRFPRTRAKPLTDERVLARLEEINPGWRAWAGNFGQRARP